MNSRTSHDIYGYRARIGYTCPPLSAEIFPYEFYKLVPAGVTLVLTTLTVVERSEREVDQAYAMSLRAAHDVCRARRQGLLQRRRAGEGGEGARLQEGRGRASLRSEGRCAARRRCR